MSVDPSSHTSVIRSVTTRVAGQLTDPEAVSLVRATAVNRLDRANSKVFQMVADLRAVDPARIRGDSEAVLREFTARAGRVASTQPGVLPEDCLDPIDRTAWVGRLDSLRDLMRGHPDDIERSRAEILDAITYTLSNC